MKIIWSNRAISDLDEAFAYIAKDSKTNALKMIRRIRKRTKLLTRFPELGSVVGNRRGEQVRELLENPYRIFYAVKENQIEIVRVYHGARRLPRWLETNEE